MSVKDIRRVLERQADRGNIPEARVMPLTLGLVVESAVQAFHQAYYGELLDTQIQSVRSMDHLATDNAMNRLESTITDMRLFRNMHAETLTTSDFPLALALSRQATQRPAYTYPESDLLAFSTRRTADNFKALKSTRPGSLNHRILPVRPESTNLQYSNFYTTEDGYTVANYELGQEYTWEAYINDELGEFTAAAAELGAIARRTRSWVVFDAIMSRATRITVPNAGETMTAANLDNVADYLAAQTVSGKPVGRDFTDIFVPLAYRRRAERAMRDEYTAPQVANPVYQMATVHVEDLLIEFGAEYQLDPGSFIAMDGRQRPLEFATLRGYEGGPKTFSRVVDVQETDLEGNFENHIAAFKVSDNVGATIRDLPSVVIAEPA